MTAFSNTLSVLIRTRKTNISSLSAECGIERTLLHKYISGTRTPTDMNAARSIADALMLSPAEKNTLCENFRLTALGEEGYMTVLESEKILNYLSNIPQPDIISLSPEYEPLRPMTVSDRLSVDTTIKRILRSRRTDTVTVISPPGYATVTQELISACIDRPDISIKHILCFEGRSGSCSNLRKFSDILPLIIFCRNYTPLINYTYPLRQQSSVSLLPCLILTGQYAFAFNFGADKGILHTNHDTIALYKTLTDRICNNSSELIYKKITSVPEESDVILKINNNLFVEKSDKCLCLIFKENSFFSKIMIYEQSLRSCLECGIHSSLLNLLT